MGAHLQWQAMPHHLNSCRGVGGRSLLARLIGVLAVTAMALGCSPSVPEASVGKAGPAQSADKPGGGDSKQPTASVPSPPQPGECRNLRYDATSLFSDDTSPIPCKRGHTAYTFAVKKLPKDIAFTGVQIENDAVQNFAGAACRTAFARFIGGGASERALSRLTVTYFVPTQRHFDLGAHWVRCDVIALRSDSTLADLPQELRGILDGEGSLNAYGVCSRGEPGSSGFRLVMCNQDHAYRAEAALRLGRGDAPYPGEQVTRVGGRQRCEDLMADLLGTDGGYTYGWTYPSPSDWQAGQRYGYCWHKTRD